MTLPAEGRKLKGFPWEVTVPAKDIICVRRSQTGKGTEIGNLKFFGGVISKRALLPLAF